MSEAEAIAVQLVKDALFLRTNGERPPGAPRDVPDAETWADWDRRAESFLRSLPLPVGPPDDPERLRAAHWALWDAVNHLTSDQLWDDLPPEVQAWYQAWLDGYHAIILEDPS